MLNDINWELETFLLGLLKFEKYCIQKREFFLAACWYRYLFSGTGMKSITHSEKGVNFYDNQIR